eukprot:EG_transcript_63362
MAMGSVAAGAAEPGAEDGRPPATAPAQRPKRSPPRPLQSAFEQLLTARQSLAAYTQRATDARQRLPGLEEDVWEKRRVLELCERNQKRASEAMHKVILTNDIHD